MGYTLPMSLVTRLVRHLLDLDAAEAWMQEYSERFMADTDDV